MTKAAAICLAGLIGFAGAAVAAPDTPAGVWLDHTGRGAVEILNCGDTLCGQIVWLKDKENNSLCGTKIIGGVRKVSSDTWDNGWIYSPEKESRYDVELKLLKSGKLRVLGYAGVKFLSETMIWQPAPPDLERCDKPAIKADGQPASPPNLQPETSASASTEGPAGSQSALKQPEPDIGLPAPARTAALDAPAAPANSESASSAGQSAEPPRKAAREKMCSVDLPYLRFSFPCPE